MIIGIDASRANRDVKTGVEWYSYYLIQELKKITPDDVGVVLFTDKPLRGDLANLPPNWREKVLKWPLKYLWTQLRLSLEMLMNSPDVLFVPAAALPIICPKKSFTTIHDIGFHRFPKFYGFFHYLYLVFSTYFAKIKAFKIFVPSEFTKKELVECYKMDTNKIVVTPLGVVKDTVGLTKPYTSVGLRKPISQDDEIANGNFIIFVGRLTEKKNISGIVEAFKLFKTENPDSKLKLVLVGPKGDAKVKIDNDIMRFDYLSRPEIADLLKNSRALVFPSFYEGFGLPILEAFAAGVPVITSKGIATEEAAGNAAILVNPLSTTEIKDAILKIVSDNALRQDLIQKGLERAKDFSWQKTAEMTWQILKNS
jgi:glycosyltransferase involved in cell wall biosynthesis